MKIKIKFKLMAVAEVAERRSQVGCLNAKSVGERLGCKLQQGDITLCIILYVIPHPSLQRSHTSTTVNQKSDL